MLAVPARIVNQPEYIELVLVKWEIRIVGSINR